MIFFLLIFYIIFFFFFFFFNDTATTEIYTLSLHDALPISPTPCRRRRSRPIEWSLRRRCHRRDRKSTRLNSSHSQTSYAVCCSKKKKQRTGTPQPCRQFSQQRAARQHCYNS